MNRLFLAIACTVVIAGLSAPAMVADASPPIETDQDGIRAELSVTASDVRLRWRFTRQLSHPLDTVTAAVNGRPLGVPTILPYPASGQGTAVIALLDVSGLQRQEQIERFKMTMLLLAARKSADIQMAFAVYALEGSLLVPSGNGPKETLSLLAEIPPLDEEANLSGALISSMRTLEKLPVARRAIYVLTDGHNDSPIEVADLAKLAQTTGVSVFFLIAPGGRNSDLPALTQLAEASGGEVVEGKDIAAFLGDPFGLLESGAQLDFPLGAARRFFWEPQSKLQVAMHYGDKQLLIEAPVAIASATAAETVAFAWHDHTALVIGAAGLLTLGGAGWLRLKSGRSSRPRVRRTPTAAIAALKDMDSGTVYPLRHPLVRIGRSGDNDIVLDEVTVGRAHAIIQQVGEDTFTITDQASANGTLLNNVNIDTATLTDGDIISIGSKTLRFVRR